ncbi:MAG: Gfo/Idh/MocA family oxidoreductase [Chloroflexi bacterium]|nr:Gfo/Idh/MocA family oxidoreductase [Chloroflexota bacterium]
MTTRVGIIGAGWMGVTHAQAWQNNVPRGEIVAVADVSEARARDVSERFAGGRARLHPDLEALLGDPAVEAVDICLPHHLHRPSILAAAAAGKHVLCEKPLCLSLAEAREIKSAIDESGITFMSAHNQLFTPSLVEARQLLAEGTLGKTYLARSTEAGRNTGFKTGQPPVALAPGASSWSWRLDKMQTGGGEVLDTGWHGAYRLLALADSRPVEVTAMLANFYLPELEGEDTGVVLVRFESGMIGLLVTSWAFPNAPDGWSFQVSAERGSIAGHARKLVHAPYGQPAPAERTFEPVHTFTREVTHFLDVIQAGEPGQATWEHAARVLQVILGAYTAAAERRTVALPEDPTELG